MGALEQTTGLIPITIGAGLTMKVVDEMFDRPGYRRRRRPSRRRSSRSRRSRRSSMGFGDFRNVGL